MRFCALHIFILCGQFTNSSTHVSREMQLNASKYMCHIRFRKLDTSLPSIWLSPHHQRCDMRNFVGVFFFSASKFERWTDEHILLYASMWTLHAHSRAVPYMRKRFFFGLGRRKFVWCRFWINFCFMCVQGSCNLIAEKLGDLIFLFGYLLYI